MRRNDEMLKRTTIVAAVAAASWWSGSAGHAQQPAGLPPPAAQNANAQASPRVSAALVDRVQREGIGRVIVQLNVNVAPEGQLAAQGVQQQRQAIAATQKQVLAGVAGANARVLRQFQTIPFVALEVAPAALDGLARSPLVASIEEDQVERISLAESVPLVDADDAWAAGFDGTGVTVAVLDTGVESSHSFLSGKVVSEACYASNSTCPNGGTTQTGTGSAAPCTFHASDCTHGTHVAGIVAGTSSFSGVAKGASIIAIQVFTNSGGRAGAFQSDQIAGLERVYELRNTFQIASVNMSLGGSPISSQSSCDASNTARKAAIDNLRSVGIATVAASGNDGSSAGISAPACISSAVSVGSTTKTDAISSFSNSASFLSLLAPGSSINSSVTGGGFSVFSGTSMATPHVAGAWAIIKQRVPSASVADVLTAFQNTGLSITDTRNSVTKSRIRVLAALNTFSDLDLSISDARISEGQSGTKSATFTVSLSGGTSASAVTASFATSDGTAGGGGGANASALSIPALGSASLFPSETTVASGTITKVTATITNFSHTFPRDVDVLLQGPTGATVLLMSDVGSGTDATNLTFTFDDTGPSMPSSGALSSGTFKPTNIADGEGDDVFASPAPSSPFGSTLSVFNGTNASGTWKLFVRDDTDFDGGIISGGWSLTITLSDADYVSSSGTVTIAAGSTSQTVTVTVNGDATIESSETFKMTLSNASSVNIADAEGTATIVNDDFTDTTLSGNVVKSLHVTELRTAINEARAAYGLSGFTFTDATLTAQTTRVRAVHITELRTALNEAYDSAKRTRPVYTDPTLTVGSSVIKAAHIEELRTAVANLP